MMLTFICLILIIAIFGKLLGFAVRMAWGITRILFTIVFFPLILAGLVLGGLASVMLPILLVLGVIVFVKAVA